METKKNSRCERERERKREGLVRGMRGAIWVSKFNSAHEKATESERREQERERAKTEYVGSMQRRKRPRPSAVGTAAARAALQSGDLIVRTIVREMREHRYETIDVHPKMLYIDV